MKLQSRVLTGAETFKANRAAHLGLLETVRAAAEAAAGSGGSAEQAASDAGAAACASASMRCSHVCTGTTLNSPLRHTALCVGQSLRWCSAPQ